MDGVVLANLENLTRTSGESCFKVNRNTVLHSVPTFAGGERQALS
jgi:hypothetical protein